MKEDILSPILNAFVLVDDYCIFVKLNKEQYSIEVVSKSDTSQIKNGESANVISVYQLPIDSTDYSVCFGYKSETFGCFKK